MASSAGQSAHPKAPKRSNATRWFGYDIFISFALGPPPRGTHSYASDLARRLRELDFTVFFSEDEMPPGEELDSNLRTALHKSKALVVIVNRGTLENPRWIRKEVEQYQEYCRGRPIIPINAGGALQDPLFAADAQEWLGFGDKIWLDETNEAIENGIVTEAVVNRLALVPSRIKSNVIWRWGVRSTGAILVSLVIGLYFSDKAANKSAEEARESARVARAELRRATALRLTTESQATASGARAGGDERALLQILAAWRMMPINEVNAVLLEMLVINSINIKIWSSGEKIEVLALSPDSKLIASVNSDKTLRLWHADSGDPASAPMEGHQAGVTSVVFSPDGKRIVSGSKDDTVRLWDVSTGRLISAMHQMGVTSVAFSFDGKRIVSGGEDGNLRLWDASTGHPISASMEGHQGVVTSVAFSPDGMRIVSGSGDKTLWLWNADSRQPMGAPLQGHEEGVTSVAFSPDGTRIVSDSYDATLRLWDTKSGQPIGAPLLGHKKGVMSVAFSPNGKRIVSGSADKTLRLWDAMSGQPVGEPLKKHRGSVWSVAFSPDGKHIVSGSYDKTLQVWSAINGQPVGAPLLGHEKAVTSVTFSPDSKLILSGSMDTTLRLWDASSRQPIGSPLQGHRSHVFSVAFSPDGTRIVSGSNEGTLRLWPAPKVWPNVLCAKLTRNMSHEEWREWVSPEIEYKEQCPGLPIPPDILSYLRGTPAVVTK